MVDCDTLRSALSLARDLLTDSLDIVELADRKPLWLVARIQRASGLLDAALWHLEGSSGDASSSPSTGEVDLRPPR